MRKIRDNSKGPPPDGLWRWRCPETGLVITNLNFIGLEKAVKKYLKANNYPIGANFEQDLEQNVCANMADSVCEDWEPPSVLEKMSTLARALYQAAKTVHSPLVTPEELQDRRDWCTGNAERPRCNFFAGSTNLLRVACGKCGCSGLKLALRSSVCPANKWSKL